MPGSIVAPVVGAVVSGVIGGDSGGGGGGGGGGSVSAPAIDPAQQALAQEQASFQKYITDRLKTKFQPLEDAFIDEAMRAGSDANIASKTGMAHADVMQGYKVAGNNMAEVARQRGISLNSPAAMAMTADVGTAMAGADAAAQTQARDAEVARGLALKQAAIGIGRGMDSTAASLGNSAASIYASGANTANMQLNRQRQSRMDTGYAVAPIAKAVGTAASKAWGNTGSGASANEDYTYGFVAPNNTDYGANYDSLAGWSFKDGGIVGQAKRGVRGAMPKMANGGVVTGPGGPTDDAVPAVVDGQQPIAVSNGEAVLNEKATSEVLGAPLVHIINALGVLRRTVEQGGGMAPRIPATA